jgi:hypothetical protein
MMRLSLSGIAKRTTAGVALTVCGLLTALPGRAAAQDPPPPAASMPAGSLGQGFGEAGQVVISGETFTEFNKTSNQGWAFALQPAADYFIIPNVSVGGAIGFAIGSEEYRALQVAARAGFNFNFTEHVSFWGRVGISYGRTSALGVPTSSNSFANLFVPINYHIVPRVFIGVGPFYNLNISGDASNNYGFASVVGAWW